MPPRPMYAMDHQPLSIIDTATIILHNMRVEEFVSGFNKYNPSDSCGVALSPLPMPGVPRHVQSKIPPVDPKEISMVGKDCS